MLLALPLEVSTLFLLSDYPIVWAIATAFILVTLLFLVLVYLPLFYKNFSYKIHDDTLLIKKGVVYRSETKIPRERIQYVAFVATPIERLLRLKTAVIYTAGSFTLIGSLDKCDDI